MIGIDDVFKSCKFWTIFKGSSNIGAKIGFRLLAFVFLLLKSKDGKDILEVMRMANIPSKIVLVTEKIVN